MRVWILALGLMVTGAPALADIAPGPEKGSGCKCSQSAEAGPAAWAALGGVALAAGLARRRDRTAAR